MSHNTKFEEEVKAAFKKEPKTEKVISGLLADFSRLVLRYVSEPIEEFLSSCSRASIMLNPRLYAFDSFPHPAFVEFQFILTEAELLAPDRIEEARVNSKDADWMMKATEFMAQQKLDEAYSALRNPDAVPDSVREGTPNLDAHLLSNAIIATYSALLAKILAHKITDRDRTKEMFHGATTELRNAASLNVIEEEFWIPSKDIIDKAKQLIDEKNVKAFVVEEPKRKIKLEIENEPLIIDGANLGVMVKYKVPLEIIAKRTENCKVTVYRLGSK
nr:hypothetical protein [Candidatus Njordarchaeota archaeon]